jgi:hypothetical protein
MSERISRNADEVTMSEARVRMATTASFISVLTSSADKVGALPDISVIIAV